MLSDGVNEVTAVCRLYVRLVTDDMLANSVTVRIDDINRDAFLSPLYHLFVSAVAAVVPSTEDSIFVVSVLDDTEVVGRHVLNVTLAVRRLVDRAGHDVFYPARFLREKVYLQRQLLAKLSTLEVSTARHRLFLAVLVDLLVYVTAANNCCFTQIFSVGVCAYMYVRPNPVA